MRESSLGAAVCDEFTRWLNGSLLSSGTTAKTPQSEKTDVKTLAGIRGYAAHWQGGEIMFSDFPYRGAFMLDVEFSEKNTKSTKARNNF